MKSKQKSLMLKIILIFIVILITDTFAPFYTSNAGFFEALQKDSEEWFWSKFFNAISKFLADIADIVIEALQYFFLGEEVSQNYSGSYDISTKLIKFSPGIIFSGQVPAFDINFISPNPPYESKRIEFSDGGMETVEKKTFDVKKDLGYEETEPNKMMLKLIGGDRNSKVYRFIKTGILESKSYDTLVDWEDVIAEDRYKSTNVQQIIMNTKYDPGLDIGKEELFIDGIEYGTETNKSVPKPEVAKTILKDKFGIECNEKTTYDIWRKNGAWYNANEIEVCLNGETDVLVGCQKYRYHSAPDFGNKFIVTIDFYVLDYLMPGEPQELYEKGDIKYSASITVEHQRIKILAKEVKTGKIIESSASILQKTVATWYNVMKTIAVVGLLSVLVYVAIRMIISSSIEDKAKYKKMLGDWIAALCLIYLLHYFMALILVILKAICDVFKSGVIGQFEEDVLMSSIRTTIENGNGFFEQFANIVVYLVLVILTVIYTYQYLKRFIYAAFLTMIAPLIALTYPIDKIKDGQAQAYTTWLREYVFNAFIQAVHLVVYFVLLGSTSELLNKDNPETYNPIFAIVAISFMLPAEKFIRKMFGFDKAEATNTLGAAVGGAALMQAINGMGKNSSKGAKDGSGEKGEENTKIRTANQDKNPYDTLKGENRIGQSNEGTGKGEGQKRSIRKGLGNVAKRYVFNKNTAKGILKGGAKLVGGATLGTIGLAAGIATGEPEKALAGAVGGFAAGRRVGGNLVEGGENLINGVSGGIKGIGDTYKEGKYGKDEYARMKFDKEFKKSVEYKKFIKKHQGREKDVQEFLDAGITDIKMMDKAIEKNYDIQEAIGFMKMAQAPDCPDEVLYDKEKFKTYLETRGIPETEAERIRKGIVTFK